MPEIARTGPGARPRRGRVVALAVIGLVLLGVVAGAVLLVVDRGEEGRATATSDPPVRSDPTITSITAGSLTGSAALAELERIADVDHPIVERDLVDRWQPQLASERVGQAGTADQESVDAGEILDRYLELKEQHPTVRLVRSADYPTFTEPGFWVVVLGTTFGSPDAANAWCDDQQIPAGRCFAKLITYDEVDPDAVYRTDPGSSTTVGG